MKKILVIEDEESILMALEDEPSLPRYITSARGIGYKFSKE